MLALLVPAAPLAAQFIDTAGFVRGLFRDYLGRDPGPEELSAWIRSMQRGTPASEVHAYVLASDECFARNRRDPATWIQAAFSVALRRQPTQRDMNYWLGKFDSFRGDRLAWSREFLRGADWQAPNPTQPPVSLPPRDLPLRLVTTSQLLTQSVQAELPGSRGWLAQSQANNLLTSAEANRFVLARPANNPAAFTQALTNLQTTVDALRATLAQAGPTAPTSRQYVEQVYQIVAAIRDTVPTPIVLPEPPPPPLPSGPIGPGCIDQTGFDEFVNRTAALHRETHVFESILKSTTPRDWTVERLMRDAEAFHAGVDQFKVEVKLGARRSDLQATLVRLRTDADQISYQMRQGNVDRRIAQAWYDVGLALNRLSDYGGAAGTGPADPWQPVPYTAGSGGLPVNIGGPSQPTATLPGLRRLDEAIAQCVSLSTALTPYAFQSPVIASVQSELRTLQNSLLELRQVVQQRDSWTQMQRSVAHVRADYQRVEDLWNRVLNSPGVPRDLPDLSTLRAAVQQGSDLNQFSYQP